MADTTHTGVVTRGVTGGAGISRTVVILKEGGERTARRPGTRATDNAGLWRSPPVVKDRLSLGEHLNLVRSRTVTAHGQRPCTAWSEIRGRGSGVN